MQRVDDERVRILAEMWETEWSSDEQQMLALDLRDSRAESAHWRALAARLAAALRTSHEKWYYPSDCKNSSCSSCAALREYNESTRGDKDE